MSKSDLSYKWKISLTDFSRAHLRMPIEVMTSGLSMSSFQASHPASRMASQLSNARFERKFARRYCQIFSTGFS